MFIREVKKQRSKDSKIFFQYTLVQASRVDGVVRQRVILYLGSDVELNDKNDRYLVLQALKAKIFGNPNLFPIEIPENLNALAIGYYQKYLLKYGDGSEIQGASLPPTPQKAEYHNIDLMGLEVIKAKSFGAEHLCRQVLDKLKLEECLRSVGMDREQAHKCLIAIAARAIFSSSEHKTAQILNMNSELGACFGIHSDFTHKQLYNISDEIFKHKDKIDQFLYQRITDMFDIEDKLVIFDISNTYFETNKRGSNLVKYGRSKEKRNDCPLVVFTGVINAQGFIRHSRIYEGNCPDTKTLSDMIADLESHSDNTSKKTIVMDAGIATEDNLALLREKKYDYVCVSRKRLKHYPISKDGQEIQITDSKKQKIKLSIFHPEQEPDTWMYVQSDFKRKKEQSMSKKLTDFFEQDMQSIRSAFQKKGGTKKIEKVWERIGRAKQKHNGVSGQYEINVEQQAGLATEMTWKRKSNPLKADKENGVYFIRTSYKNPSETQLWDIYNTIREVESTFRCLKSELQMRPVFHQTDLRIEAHIYLTLLAYQLVNTIRHMLKKNDIHYNWSKILRIMSTQTIQTIELPTDKKTIHLLKPAKPIKEVSQIYSATNCIETQKTIKKYVVYH